MIRSLGMYHERPRHRRLPEQLQQDLLSEASLAGEERMIRDVFVERMVADLSEAGELDDGTACFHQARGVEVSGYNISEDGHPLDLFGVVLTQTAPRRPSPNQRRYLYPSAAGFP